jgi:hypothetical protein
MKARQRDLGNARLMVMLNELRDMKCTNEGDRIFSLLSLCAEGSIIQVDYGIPNKILASYILSQCKHTLCICSMHLIGSTLSYKEWTTSVFEAIGPYLEIDIGQCDSSRFIKRSAHFWDVMSLSDGTLSSVVGVGLPSLRIFPSWDTDFCDTTALVLRQLQFVVIGDNLSASTTDQGTPAFFIGEEIHAPHFITDRVMAPKNVQHELRAYANGFSFDKTGHSQASCGKMRISIDVIWTILKDTVYTRKLCDGASRHLEAGPSPSFKMGYGPWNTALDEEECTIGMTDLSLGNVS